MTDRRQQRPGVEKRRHQGHWDRERMEQKSELLPIFSVTLTRQSMKSYKTLHLSKKLITSYT